MLVKPLERLSFLISAAAAIVVLVACIVIGATLIWMALWVSITLFAFYIIGEVVRYVLVSSLYPPELEEDEFLGEMFDDGEEEISAEVVYDEAEEPEAESEPIESAFLDN